MLQDENMTTRYDYYKGLVGAVDRAVEIIQSLPKSKCYDPQFIETEVIPLLGLNNEALHEQPRELQRYFGTGLHLWQYPNQISKYLVWLAFNATSIRNYLEVGCRWGGTFILTCEWLRKIGAPLEFAVAVDPIPPTPFMSRYSEIASIPILYKQMLSTSNEFRTFARSIMPEMVFIDGDHSMSGVMNDHLLFRNNSKIIVHHDVMSQVCPHTTLFWSYLKLAEENFENVEFVEQYSSTGGNYLGIGILMKKS